ncbi:MAG: hypothetical protein AB8F26_05485 [Phycisphaerales bacterium]
MGDKSQTDARSISIEGGSKHFLLEIEKDFREAVAEVGPLRAWLRVAHPRYIMDLHYEGQSLGEHLDRCAVQGLVKVKLPILRGEAERSVKPSDCHRIIHILNEIESLAWELMHSIDGVAREDMVADRKIRQGPWIDPMLRMYRLCEQASFTALGIEAVPTGSPKALTNSEKCCLEALCSVRSALTFGDVGRRAGVPDPRRALKSLRKLGFVDKPSERGGYIATEEGKSVIERMRS